MQYIKIPPPASLERYVRYFWVVDNPTANGPRIFRPITDGCPGLMLQLEATTSVIDQYQKELPSFCLYGQTIRHREIHASEPFKAMGICFTPLALKTIFGLDAHELTDTCLDLNELLGNHDRFLQEQFWTATSLEQRINLLSNYLEEQLRINAIQTDNLTDYALRQLIRSKGNVSLKDLQAELNVSERLLERRFKQSVGISPNLFARICRFQASLHQLKTSRFDKLSDIAFDNGYADQSHFIRTFKEFAGFSPFRYQKTSNEVAENLAEWF
ncbi:helix-turn-helix transcriptional regulator [Spirosoma sp. BT702]|uniref:Helix-turn-helix transcriptional regulator n=1 Tax=Spirosoma profusum TaxID=2771354 RepID=A0A926XW26_9BACT|nr:AraC family transcriptional regulator [Spirosoma profusum]MBD2701632.1 helix-turn-helix transcriptional regulator [Spirosoma profusum]